MCESCNLFPELCNTYVSKDMQHCIAKIHSQINPIKMKSKLLLGITVISVLAFPNVSFGQVTLGTNASKFVIFTSAGAVGDNVSAHSHITGDVGTKTASSITGFGNVNGVMHDGSDAATTACGIDLAATIAQINSTPATLFPSGTMGSGITYTAGVYSIPGNATLTLDLILDANNNPNAQFIIKIGGTFATNANSRVKLINGALACNVYWDIVGMVNMASPSTMRGNIISGGAISIAIGDSLEGRAFSTPAGAITIDGITAYTPVGCGSPSLTGPAFPNLLSTTCYAVFSSNGALSNTPVTTVIGDVGNNGIGSITGWSPSEVTGTLHLTQDASTSQCAKDLDTLYKHLNALPYDIQLLYPVQFGRNLVLTPHVSLMDATINGPATFTDSLYLDAQGNTNGVFVIKIIGGALTTSTYSKVKLINGAQAKNVFWVIQGDVNINNYSVFRGTIVVPVGAISLINTGVVLDGRALTMNGAITTAGLVAAMPPGCVSTATITASPSFSICKGSSVTLTASGGNTYSWNPGGQTTTSITVNPTTTTAYTVTATTNSMTAIATQTVTVKSLAFANAGSNVTICTAGNTMLNGSGNGTYSWSPATGLSCTTCSNPTATPTINTTYTLTVTNSCGTATSIVNVVIGTSPSANAGSDATICNGDIITLNGSGSGTFAWSPVTGLSCTSCPNPAANPITPTTYTLTITASCGTKTATVAITVNPVPTVTANATATTVCAGTSVTLTGSGTATSYTWSGGVTNGVGFVPASTTTYTVTGTNASGCTKTATSAIVVKSLAFANAGADVTIMIGNSTTLNGSGNGTYNWSPSTGLSCTTCANPSANPTTTKTYTLSVTNSCGTATALVTVTVVANTTGIFAQTQASEILLYPNPTNGKFIMQVTSGDYQTANIEIYNVVGEKVLSQKMQNAKSEIDLSNEQSGIYFIQLKTNAGIVSKKIIIQK